MAYIDNSKFPAPTNAYAAWVDIMGAKSVVKKSDKAAITYILKFQQLLETVINPHKFKLYPLIDGSYIIASNKDALIEVITDFFVNFTTNVFLVEQKPGYRFIPRCTIAAGTVIHGSNIQRNDQITLSQEKLCSLVFGSAIVNAHDAEKGQPPFSIFDCEEKQIIPWFDSLSYLKNTIIKFVTSYYDYIDEYPNWSPEYDSDKRIKHRSEFNKMIDNYA